MEEQKSSGYRVRRISSVMRRVQYNKKRIKLITCDNCKSEQKFVSWIPYHAVFGFFIPLLVAVLQMSNQGTNKYSFETHPANMWAFLLATLVYCFAFAADIKSQLCNSNYSQLSCIVAVISGSLSSVSLINLFLPGLPGRLLFIIWASASVAVSHRLIMKACRWICQVIIQIFDQVVGIYWNWFKGSSPMEQPRLPV